MLSRRGYEDSRKAALASSVGRSLGFACLDRFRGSTEQRLEFEIAFEIDGEGHVVDVEKPNYPQDDDDSILRVVLDAHDGNPIESSVRLRHFSAGAGTTLTIPVLLYPNRHLCDTVTVSAKAAPSGPNSEAELEVPFTCGE